MSGLGFFQKMGCLHETSTEPDEMGEAICADCGRPFVKVLTEGNFLRTAEQVRRHGRHSMRCVETDDAGWVCADDCPSKR